MLALRVFCESFPSDLEDVNPYTTTMLHWSFSPTMLLLMLQMQSYVTGWWQVWCYRLAQMMGSCGCPNCATTFSTTTVAAAGPCQPQISPSSIAASGGKSPPSSSSRQPAMPGQGTRVVTKQHPCRWGTSRWWTPLHMVFTNSCVDSLPTLLVVWEWC